MGDGGGVPVNPGGGAAGLSPIGADWFEAFTNDTSPTAAQMMLTFEGGNTPTAPPA